MTDGSPTHCADCGQRLLLRQPGRDRCAKCGPKKYLMLVDYERPTTTKGTS